MGVEVKLPELGDGIDSGDVLTILVREGDILEKDQGILELETEKATVEVPSTRAGKVAKIHVRVGQTIPIGATLVTLEGESAPSSPEPAPAPAAASSPRPEPAATPPEPPLVSTPPESGPAGGVAASAPPPRRPAAPRASAPPTRGGVIAASPSIRRLARELAVDLRQIQGAGEGGRITREDVLAAAGRAGGGPAEAPAAPAEQAAPDQEATAPLQTDPWGPVRIERLTKMRKMIAAKMDESWRTVPRVTNFDDADVTQLDRIRRTNREDYAAKGIHLTALPFVIKSIAMALREHPMLNASLDLENGRIIYKEYVNIGVAMDTARGLVVPVIRGADKMSIPDIARRLARLTEDVRNNDFTLEDLRGGTFTVSNLGAIGGAYSTPIVNTPEVAILLIGRSRRLPIVKEDKVAVRLMMPLSLSYDHRLVDGATAARFLNETIGFLAAPSRLLLAP